MQYLIQYRRGAGADWTALEHGVHKALYGTPRVKAAVEHMEANDEVIGVALQLPAGDTAEQFNITRVPEGTVHTHIFKTKQ